MNELAKIVIICGPTCAGKTGVSIELAKKFNGEIVYADSGAVWRGLDIGTAKPTKEERADVPHHLIDVVEPSETFDVGRYLQFADEAIKGIVSRGKRPFVVGGTGLYIRALCHGLTENPPRNEEFRGHLADIKEEKGIEFLYRLLQEKDPLTAARLKPKDTTRIIRALEVLHLTGQSISEQQNTHKFKHVRYNTLKLGLNIERAELYRRIDERVDQMMKAGLADEVKALVKKYGPNCQAFSAVGYKELVRWPEEAKPSNYRTIELSNQIKRNTRHYAKRQLTWFRADKEIKWVNSTDMLTNFSNWT